MSNMAIENSRLSTTFLFNSLTIITTKKLVGNSNYISWSASIELWCIGQGIEDHLTIKAKDIKFDKTTQIRTDVAPCSMLQNTIDTQLQPILKAY